MKRCEVCGEEAFDTVPIQTVQFGSSLGVRVYLFSMPRVEVKHIAMCAKHAQQAVDAHNLNKKIVEVNQEAERKSQILRQFPQMYEDLKRTWS